MAINMKTVILDAGKSESITLCADVIKGGGLVAFATETVYGLGANALDKMAVEGIFEVKGRPYDNPLIVHVASVDDVRPLVNYVPDIFGILAERYMPGSLTLIMKKSSIIPDNVTAGLDTVAVRIPKHPAALAFIKACGCPIAAPSANPSGKPSPTKAIHVLIDIGGKIQYILDGGDCVVGLESTVLDISGDVPRIMRPGFVTFDELKDLLGNVKNSECILSGKVDIKSTEAPKSPGIKYRHYSPNTPLTAILGLPDDTAKYITEHMDNTTAALMFDDYTFSHPNVVTFGHSRDYNAQAALLYDALRKLDNKTAAKIYAQTPSEDGLGIAVANRIKKAAGDNIIEVV